MLRAVAEASASQWLPSAEMLGSKAAENLM
jgi:hypothetical protein